jgi:hypothetical protein
MPMHTIETKPEIRAIVSDDLVVALDQLFAERGRQPDDRPAARSPLDHRRGGVRASQGAQHVRHLPATLTEPRGSVRLGPLARSLRASIREGSWRGRVCHKPERVASV